jgi:glycosyltransferase involved in cell wall biosynthesis
MGELVLLCGRDPLRFAGGSESYASSRALAARRCGLHPHLFAASGRTETLETPFGTVHRVLSPWRSTAAHAAACHRRALVRAVVSFLRARPGPHLIQSYAGWSKLATDAAGKLNAEGVATATYCEFYSYVGHEQQGKLGSRLVRASRWRRLEYSLLLAWVRAVSIPTERAGYLRADRVAVNYENVRRLLVAAYGERSIERISYCAPLAFRGDATFVERPADVGGEHEPLIVSVSRHSARKGLDILIRALAVLRDRGDRFRATLVGTGPMLAANRALVTELGLDPLVSLPGRVDDVLPYLRDCEVYVLPSTTEDSGAISVLEALQAGAPIVSTDVDGLPEDLEHERNALLVPPWDSRALADAISRLLADPELRRSLSRGARGTYETRFTAERAAADLARVYEILGLHVPARVQ